MTLPSTFTLWKQKRMPIWRWLTLASITSIISGVVYINKNQFCAKAFINLLIVKKIFPQRTSLIKLLFPIYTSTVWYIFYVLTFKYMYQWIVQQPSHGYVAKNAYRYSSKHLRSICNWLSVLSTFSNLRRYQGSNRIPPFTVCKQLRCLTCFASYCYWLTFGNILVCSMFFLLHFYLKYL